MTVEIRLVHGEELLTTSYPLTTYAFQPSPQPADQVTELRAGLAHRVDRRTHVVFDDGAAVATATVLPMTQELRGRILPMGGVAGVATDPGVRRRGHARGLLTHVLADMRAQGQVVSTLYPFRPSFYQRIGYVGLPKPTTVRFRPDGLAGLLSAGIDGTVTCRRIGEAFDEYWEFLVAVQRHTPGMALRARTEAAAAQESDDEWVATARIGDAVVGVCRYRLGGFAEPLDASCFLHLDARARILLLQWLARHADQVSGVTLPLSPDATPELWHADLELTLDKQIAIPARNAPMARVLDVAGLAGMRVGVGEVAVRVVDDLLPAAAGVYTLASDGGELVVRPGGDPTATLNSSGLAGLVYGVLDPDELAPRGFGDADDATRDTLRSLFPRTVPHLYEVF